MANLAKTLGVTTQQAAAQAAQPKPIPAGSPEAQAARDMSAVAQPYEGEMLKQNKDEMLKQYKGRMAPGLRGTIAE